MLERLKKEFPNLVIFIMDKDVIRVKISKKHELDIGQNTDGTWHIYRWRGGPGKWTDYPDDDSLVQGVHRCVRRH